MKKIFMLLLIMVMVFSFAACGGDEGTAPENGDVSTGQQETSGDESQNQGDESQNQGNDQQEGWLATKTGRFYSQYEDAMYMEYETSYEGMNLQTITATKGDKSYTANKMDGQDMGSTVLEGKNLYTIDHSSKTIIKMEVEADGQNMTNTLVKESDIDPSKLVAGTKEINGKTYDTEEWAIEGAKTTFCFDSDKLAYMIGEFEGEKVTMKILKVSDKVDDALFEIPSDYQMMSY